MLVYLQDLQSAPQMGESALPAKCYCLYNLVNLLSFRSFLRLVSFLYLQSLVTCVLRSLLQERLFHLEEIAIKNMRSKKCKGINYYNNNCIVANLIKCLQWVHAINYPAEEVQKPTVNHLSCEGSDGSMVPFSRH